jgi:thiamine-monophosphate kinase
LLRSGARVGDDIWVSGQPGRAARGLAHLQGRYALDEARRENCLTALHQPQPRVALGLALRGLANAAIDVSDGLLADLNHVLAASRVSAHLLIPDLPPAGFERDCLLAGGDDYELAFTTPPARRAEVEALAARLRLALTRIGIVHGDGSPRLRLTDAAHNPIAIGSLGYEHFR